METQRAKLTKGGLNAYSLPLDLTMEILKRLQVKTLIRFLCVSKLWCSTIRGRYFKKLFLNASLARPKSLVFVFVRKYNGLNPLEVHHKNYHEQGSSSAPSLATYHVTISTKQRSSIAPSVHGLICYGPASRLVIFNPRTRRSVTLPRINAGRRATNQYLGYDPVHNDYKVLCIMRKVSTLRNRRGLAEEMRVLTLGTRDSWRMIQGTIPPHSPVNQELCINGVLYYQAFVGAKLTEPAVMSFDVRSEKLGLIRGPCTFPTFSMLTSYEAKLAVVFFEKRARHGTIVAFWVLQDPCKEEWSKKTFVLPDLAAYPYFYRIPRFSTTDTDTGEIVFTPSTSAALYCDLKENSVRYFKIEGKEANNVYFHAISVSGGQVDNLMFL